MMMHDHMASDIMMMMLHDYMTTCMTTIAIPLLKLEQGKLEPRWPQCKCITLHLEHCELKANACSESRSKKFGSMPTRI